MTNDKNEVLYKKLSTYFGLNNYPFSTCTTSFSHSIIYNHIIFQNLSKLFYFPVRKKKVKISQILDF